MVKTARRYGTKVRPIEERSLLDVDVAAWHAPDRPRLRQMFAETTELRCIIEPGAAAIAAVRATGDQNRTILEAAHAMHPDGGDVRTLIASDCPLHSTILEATGNLMMRQLRPIISTVLRISYEFGVRALGGEPVTREGHIRVAEAMRARDGQAAYAEIERMLERNRRAASQYWASRAQAVAWPRRAKR